MKKLNSLFFCAIMVKFLLAQSVHSFSADGLLHTADSFYFTQNWSEAKLAYKTVLKTDTISAIQWYRLGFSCFNLGDYDEAINSYNNGLERNPSTQVPM